jgi:hypothetical protein
MALGLGLQLKTILRQSQSLELRQRLEQSLSRELQVTISLKLELKLYRKREEVVTSLYKEALRQGRVKIYNNHGLLFEYAVVRAKDVPDEIKKHSGYAFSHCLYSGFDALIFGQKYAVSRGSWLLFVIEDLYPDIPAQFLEYGAVHERGEQVTLGDHNLASKLEFAIAKEERVLLEYMDWIEANCPTKFGDIFNYQTHLDLPDTDDFQDLLETFASSDEAAKIKSMIEGFRWPTSLLQKLNFYKRKNDELVVVISRAWRAAEMVVYEGKGTLKVLVEEVRRVVAEELAFVVTRGLWRYMSTSHIEPLWRELRLSADRKFVELLNTRKASTSYVQQIIDAKIADSLPNDGVLSSSFAEVLEAL